MRVGFHEWAYMELKALADLVLQHECGTPIDIEALDLHIGRIDSVLGIAFALQEARYRLKRKKE